MFWIYALVGTAGLVAIVPSILRAIDGHDADMATELVGSVATTFGAIGVLFGFTELRGTLTFALALLFGLAAGAATNELLRELRGRQTTHDDV